MQVDPGHHDRRCRSARSARRAARRHRVRRTRRPARPATRQPWIAQRSPTKAARAVSGGVITRCRSSIVAWSPRRRTSRPGRRCAAGIQHLRDQANDDEQHGQRQRLRRTLAQPERHQAARARAKMAGRRCRHADNHPSPQPCRRARRTTAPPGSTTASVFEGGAWRGDSASVTTPPARWRWLIEGQRAGLLHSLARPAYWRSGSPLRASARVVPALGFDCEDLAPRGQRLEPGRSRGQPAAAGANREGIEREAERARILDRSGATVPARR